MQTAQEEGDVDASASSEDEAADFADPAQAESAGSDPVLGPVDPTISRKARLHYDKLMALCPHDDCMLKECENLAGSFSRRDKFEGCEVVRCLLLATSARPGPTNHLK